ncbi:MAG TPA: hypothetical protein VLA21_10205 [Candidatus Limnocylindria bacterium]|nr:hypothetical protein [Candidatus Limnocylindria bacterium]
MKVMDWLTRGDPAAARLARVQLLGAREPYTPDGATGRILALYDPERKTWGGGLYSPKWTSGTYTLLELRGMDADPAHPACREGAQTVLEGVWRGAGGTAKARGTDVCVAGMLLRIACWTGLRHPLIPEIIDYLLARQMEDGGWNCEWDARPRPSRVGSVHTTLSVLEGFAEYEARGYGYRLAEIREAAARGRESLLARDLFKDRKTGLPLHPDMAAMHYPCRWKYDCFRALEYFADIGHPFDPRMADALVLTRQALAKGYAPRGKAYSGRTHLPAEPGRGGRHNTLRALRILKAYDPETYSHIMETEYEYPA